VLFSYSQSAEFVSMCYDFDIAVNMYSYVKFDVKYLTILVVQLIGMSVFSTYLYCF